MLGYISYYHTKLGTWNVGKLQARQTLEYGRPSKTDVVVIVMVIIIMIIMVVIVVVVMVVEVVVVVVLMLGMVV